MIKDNIIENRMQDLESSKAVPSPKSRQSQSVSKQLPAPKASNKRKQDKIMTEYTSMPNKKDKPKIEKPKDVLEEILKDHDEARELFAKLDKNHEIKDVKELYATLYGHHKAEEKHVFPDVKKVDREAKELVEDLITEHHESESGLKSMVDAKKFDAGRFTMIKADVYHHMDEEETELFEKAKEGLKQKELEDKLEPFEKTEESEKEKAE